MSPTNITFGLELEFMMDTGGEVQEPTDPLPRRLVAEHLAREAPGLPISAQCTHNPKFSCAICKDAPQDLRTHNMRVFVPNKPVFQPSANPAYRYFHVQFEDLDVPWNPISGGVTCYSLELSTPILDSSELKAGMPKMAKAVSALTSMRPRLTANNQCGLHVHVGLEGGMKLEMAKKVVTLVYLLERTLIKGLCPHKRTQAVFYKPLYTTSTFMKMAMKNRREKCPVNVAGCKDLLEHFPCQALRPCGWNLRQPTDLLDALKMVWEAESLPHLWSGIVDSSENKGSLAIVFRDELGTLVKEMSVKTTKNNYEGTPSTFEFRYPQMGFDMSFVRNWAEIACKIVEIGGTSDKAAFKAKITEIISTLDACQDGHSVGPMLECLGLKHQIPQWREQLRRYDRGEDIPGVGKDGWVVSE